MEKYAFAINGSMFPAVYEGKNKKNCLDKYTRYLLRIYPKFLEDESTVIDIRRLEYA